MSRLNKMEVYKMMLDAGSLNTPTLNKHFKQVYVGIVLKDQIKHARSKCKI